MLLEASSQVFSLYCIGGIPICSASCNRPHSKCCSGNLNKSKLPNYGTIVHWFEILFQTEIQSFISDFSAEKSLFSFVFILFFWKAFLSRVLKRLSISCKFSGLYNY
jgi:hypothetical protein